MHPGLAKKNFERDIAKLREELVCAFNWQINSKEFPVFDVTIKHTIPIRLRLRCDDWDENPPSIEALAEDGTPWKKSEIGKKHKFKGGVFNAHGETDPGFICMAGSREYHGAPGNHVGDKWENYRGKSGMDLVGIVAQLAHCWRRTMK